MSYQQLTPELTQKIINEAVNSNLSSYQIAFKYSITKSVVDRLCRQHLGSEVYNKRESLSFDYLASQIKGLRQKKYSSDRVAQALGLYKTTCFTLIKKIELEDFTSSPSSDDKVDVISVLALSATNESSQSTSNLKQSASSKTIKLTKELPLVLRKLNMKCQLKMRLHKKMMIMKFLVTHMLLTIDESPTLTGKIVLTATGIIESR
mgnify:CR=1 FL=1